MRKRDEKLAVSDGIISSRGAFRPVTLIQGIVATWADLNVLEAQRKCSMAENWGQNSALSPPLRKRPRNGSSG
jgi:hypothetical protein